MPPGCQSHRYPALRPPSAKRLPEVAGLFPGTRHVSPLCHLGRFPCFSSKSCSAVAISRGGAGGAHPQNAGTLHPCGATRLPVQVWFSGTMCVLVLAGGVEKGGKDCCTSIGSSEQQPAHRAQDLTSRRSLYYWFTFCLHFLIHLPTGIRNAHYV